MTKPLEGLLVVALEQAVAAPYCTARLADAGARVIKIERPEGDFAREYDHVVHGESAYFVWLNRGKESISLDIKKPEDAAVLAAMIARADIFIQNLAPGASARAGFGSDVLRARHPRLVTCDITGYGPDGPCARMKAYDLLIQAESGLAAVSGVPAEPGRVGISIADIGCGMNAHAAILQALYERATTQVGRGVSVSLFDGMAEWMTVPLLFHDYGGRAPARVGFKHPAIAPYGVFHTSDGLSVVMAVQNEREWKRLCADVLQAPGMAEDVRYRSNSERCAHRDSLDEEIGQAISRFTQAEFVGRLAEAGIAYGRLNEVSDLSAHPQLRRVEVNSPGGPVRLPASPMRWNSDAERSIPSSPALNEHGQALRREFGPGAGTAPLSRIEFGLNALNTVATRPCGVT